MSMTATTYHHFFSLFNFGFLARLKVCACLLLVYVFAVGNAQAVDILSDTQLQTLFVPSPKFVGHPSPKDDCKSVGQNAKVTSKSQDAHLFHIKQAECEQNLKTQGDESSSTQLNNKGEKDTFSKNPFGDFEFSGSNLDSLTSTLNADDSSGGMTAEDFLSLFGLSAGDLDRINLSGLLGVGEASFSRNLLDSLADWQNQQAIDSILSGLGSNSLGKLEAIIAGQLGQSLLSSLLGGSGDNYGEGSEIQIIDYMYEPISDEHHLEIVNVSTGWRVINVEIDR